MSLISVVTMVPAEVRVMVGGLSRRTDSMWSRTRSSMRSRAGRLALTSASSWTRGEEGEAVETTFTLLDEADCQISSALASSFLGSLISSLMRLVLMFGGK